jgi:putative iron-dependent peroxidase
LKEEFTAMPTPQKAICPPASSFAIFLTFCLKEGHALAVRPLLAAIPLAADDTAKRLAEPLLYSGVGVGAAAWVAIFGGPPPDGLVPFQALHEGPRQAPSTPADLFIHIRGARHDACFALARSVVDLLAGTTTLVEEIHGFRNHEARDLTGFVDGTENPTGDERAVVALVPENAGLHAGGSYVSVQRYVHALDRWERLAVSEQEAAIGRTKADDVELAGAVKPPFAHISRVVIEEDGEELEILRQGLPYGTTSTCGVYFVAYCRRPEPFRQMLDRMVRSASDGHHDRLLDFTQAVTGASFFMPSREFLSG